VSGARPLLLRFPALAGKFLAGPNSDQYVDLDVDDYLAAMTCDRLDGLARDDAET